jgi:hypothetical protein
MLVLHAILSKVKRPRHEDFNSADDAEDAGSLFQLPLFIKRQAPQILDTVVRRNDLQRPGTKRHVDQCRPANRKPPNKRLIAPVEIRE